MQFGEDHYQVRLGRRGESTWSWLLVGRQERWELRAQVQRPRRGPTPGERVSGQLLRDGQAAGSFDRSRRRRSRFDIEVADGRGRPALHVRSVRQGAGWQAFTVLEPADGRLLLETVPNGRFIPSRWRARDASGREVARREPLPEPPAPGAGLLGRVRHRLDQAARDDIVLDASAPQQVRAAAVFGFLASDLCRDRGEKGDGEIPVLDDIIDDLTGLF